MAVTINAPDDWNDHRFLLEQGFSGFVHRNFLQEGQIIGYTEIAGGDSGRVQLLAAEDFDYALAPDEEISLLIPGSGFVYAPVTAGGEAGYAHVCVNGKSVGKVSLVYGQTIEQIKIEEKRFWDRLIGGD